MAEIFWPDCVLYKCSCNLASPFTHLYFCRYCVQVRCQMCVHHEVDSYFCPNCLENMPSAEAKLKKNRCANCYECPSCGNTLSTRATAVAIAADNPEEKATARKVFYLACGFCRWSTRDVGIPDRSNASGGWQDPENPISKRVNNLVDYYKKLSTREKYERERINLKKKSYIHITSPASFSMKTKSASPGLLKKRSSLSLLKSLGATRGESFEFEEITFDEPAEATEQPPRQALYTEVVQLEKAASISQMLAQPDFQHTQTSDFHPKHKHLVAKRSQRCRPCEHNLCKPEFNPNSTKFKIQFFAINYVPQLQIAHVPELCFRKKSRVTFSLNNPSDYVVSVTLKNTLASGDENEESKEEKQDEMKIESVPSKESIKGTENEHSKGKGIAKQREIKKERQELQIRDDVLEKALNEKEQKISVDNSSDNRIFEETAEINLPASPLLLTAKDDAAEFDENEIAVVKFEDDPNIVASRQANKLWFYIDVTPSKVSGNVEFSVLLKYDFKVVLSNFSKVAIKENQEEAQEVTTVQLQQLVYLNLGEVKFNKDEESS